MVEILGSGDNSLPNNTIQEARSFLATIVSALATIGTMIYNWFLSIANRLFTMMQTHPMEFVMFITNLAILFS
jgi:hypothetical protein